MKINCSYPAGSGNAGGAAWLLAWGQCPPRHAARSVAEMEAHRTADIEFAGFGSARRHKIGLPDGLLARGLQNYAVQKRGLRRTERLGDDRSAKVIVERLGTDRAVAAQPVGRMEYRPRRNAELVVGQQQTSIRVKKNVATRCPTVCLKRSPCRNGVPG